MMKTIADFLKDEGGHVALMTTLVLIFLGVYLYFPDDKFIGASFNMAFGGLLTLLKLNPKQLNQEQQNKENNETTNKVVTGS